MALKILHTEFKCFPGLRILVLNTAMDYFSAALLNGGDIFYYHDWQEKKHGQLILPVIQTLLNQTGIKLSYLDAIGFVAGPGSFTGVRIGASVVQGLAYTLDTPIISISTLAFMAQSAYSQFQSPYVLTALDARMQEIYWGIYKVDDQKLMKPIIQDEILPPDGLIFPESLSVDSIFLGVGSGWEIYREICLEKLKDHTVSIKDNFYTQIKDIFPLVIDALNKGKILSSFQAIPVYLRHKIV